jgi:hypothetical protein
LPVITRITTSEKYIHPTNESMTRAVARKKVYADQQMQRATKKTPLPGVFPRVVKKVCASAAKLLDLKVIRASMTWLRRIRNPMLYPLTGCRVAGTDPARRS